MSNETMNTRLDQFWKSDCQVRTPGLLSASVPTSPARSPHTPATPNSQRTYISSPLAAPQLLHVGESVSHYDWKNGVSIQQSSYFSTSDNFQEPPSKRRCLQKQGIQQYGEYRQFSTYEEETVEYADYHSHATGSNCESSSVTQYSTTPEIRLPQSEQPPCELNGQLCDLVKDEVCFGMIKDIPLALANSTTHLSHTQSQSVLNDIDLDPLGQVFLRANKNLLGSLSDQWSQILQHLYSEDLTIQIRCKIRAVDNPHVKFCRHRRGGSYRGFLEAILYGPEALCTDIGDLLEECKVFLQDPKGCDRNVPYRNPHSWSGMQGNPPMTIPDEIEALIVSEENNQKWTSCLDDLVFRQDLVLASTPKALQTHLYDHQRQALTFMQERERGWNFSGLDVWKVMRNRNSYVYVNTLTGDEQTEKPASFRGGLLADGMGLGKTLTTISLVASDLDESQFAQRTSNDVDEHVPTTLIVVPPPLLQTWKNQFAHHCKEDTIRIHVHHGKNRLTSKAECAKYHVVLTSYHTVSVEYRRLIDYPSTLFLTRWHRIVLDEAHLIRDDKTQMSKAICALQAGRRWAVTGTPIQNHVTDFSSLLRFLQVHPYDDPSRFIQDIVQLWKFDHEAAIERFRRLITYITLRRTNTILNLPKRTDETHYLHLDPTEEALYDVTHKQAHEAVKQSADSTQGKVHAWCTLNMLRSICNHGILAKTRTVSEPSDSIASSFTEFPEINTPNYTDQGASFEFDTYCPESESEYAVSTSTTPVPTQTQSGPGNPIPTKIKALLKDLRSHPASKSVVFTMWSTTIDIIVEAFTNADISYVRYDGRVSSRARDLALDKFRADPSIRVILLTISCGAVGLDITAADRAYLIEPQWNPTVEDQALARIHRLGQTRPVTTVRFIIKDSIEERVVALQKRKKRFAELLLTDKWSGAQTTKFEGFQCLKSLLS